MTIPKPQYINGLTTAETMQLSLDYAAAPETFEEAKRFHGIFIDDIDIFREQLLTVLVAENTHDSQHADFRRLEDRINEVYKNPKGTRTGTAIGSLGYTAIAAASAKIRDDAKDLVDLRLQADISGEMISTAFADYMKERLPRQSKASFNGSVYEWPDDIVMSRSKEARRVDLTVYGSLNVLAKYFEKYAKQNGNPEVIINPKHVTPKGWLNFINNLTILTRY